MSDEAPTPARRVIGRTAAALGYGAAFVAALVGGAVAHLDVPLTRRVVGAAVERVLDDTLRGEFEVGAVEVIEPGEIVIARFEAADLRGEPTLSAERIRLHGPWLEDLVWFAWSGEDELRLPNVRIERGDVTLAFVDDELTLARLFTPEPVEPVEPTEPVEPPPFFVSIDAIELGRVRVHGQLAPALGLDATVTRLAATLEAGTRGVSLHVARSSLEERALLGATTTGTFDFHLEVEPTTPGDPPIATLGSTFSGHVGPVQLSAEGRLDDGQLAVVLDVPRVGPEELEPWLPTSPVQRAFAARATLSGRPPDLALTGEVLVPSIADEPPAEIAMAGRMSVADAVLLDARLSARQLDLRLFDGDLPRTALGARAHVRGRLAGADTELYASVASSQSEVAGEVVPPVEGVAEIAQTGIETFLVVREPGVDAAVNARYAPSGAVGLAFAADARSLSQVPRLAAWVPGGAHGGLSVRGTGDIDGDEIDVVVDAAARGLAVRSADTRLDSGRVHARIRGKKGDLSLEAHGRGSGLDAADQRISSFEVEASGPLTKPRVRAHLRDEQRRKLTARGRIEPERGRAEGVEVQLERDGDVLRGRIEEVRAEDGRLAADGIVLEGLGGKVQGGLRIIGGEIAGQLEAHDLEVQPLLSLVGVKLPYPLRGRAQADIDLTPTRRGREGHVRIRVDDARMLRFGGDVQLDAAFEERTVRPRLSVTLEGNPQFGGEDAPCARYGTLVVGGEGELAGALLDPKSWLTAEGEGAAHLAGVELACLKDEWMILPVGELDGELTASIQLELDPDRALPSVPAFALRTHGLVYAPEPESEDTPPPWRSEGLDVAASGSFDADSGRTHLELSALDNRGGEPEPPRLVEVSGDATLDVDALRAGGEEAMAAVEAMPLTLDLHTGRQPIARLGALPEPWGPQIAATAAGFYELDAHLEGSLGDPALAVRLRGTELAPADRPEGWDLPADVDLMASYHDGTGRLDGAILRDDEKVAVVEGGSDGDIAARLWGHRTDGPWSGWLETKLLGLPLGSLPALGSAGVRGELRGHARVEGLGDAPELDVALRVSELRVGSAVVFDDARVRMHPIAERPGVVSVEAALPVRGQPPRGLLVSGYGALRWRDELIPSLDPDEPAALVATASRFPVATVEPFLGDDVGRVDGRLDGEVHLTYKEMERQPVALDVQLELDEGLLQLPGMELRDIEAQVRSKPGLLEVPYVSAAIQTGRITGRMSSRLRGLEPLDFSGHFTVADGEPVPVSLKGSPLGALSGTVDVMVQRKHDPDENVVRIHASRLHLQLAASTGKDVQSLDLHPDVRLTHAIEPPEPDEDEEGGIPTTIMVRLDSGEVEGNAVRIELATSDEKPPEIEIDGPARGTILLTGGELNLLGKRFTIERGVVRLEPDNPGNPYVNATASWTSPEGTVVFIDYVGPLNPITRDKFRFRSSPPRSQEALIALLLLGESPGDDIASAEGGDRAGSLGQGIAAAQMNALLGQFAPGLSTSIATTDDGYVATTVTYQFSDEVTGSATFAQSQGVKQEQQGPDQSAQQRTTFSLDWRFAPHWLIRGSVGVGQGATSGLDLLFNYRY